MVENVTDDKTYLFSGRYRSLRVWSRNFSDELWGLLFLEY